MKQPFIKIAIELNLTQEFFQTKRGIQLYWSIKCQTGVELWSSKPVRWCPLVGSSVRLQNSPQTACWSSGQGDSSGGLIHSLN